MGEGGEGRGRGEEGPPSGSDVEEGVVGGGDGVGGQLEDVADALRCR